MAGKIVKKEYSDDFYSYSISYDAGSDCGTAAGMHLEGGIPIMHEGKKYVRFDKVKGRQIHLKLEGRPDLEKLVLEYEELQAQLERKREEERAAKLAKRKEIDAPLLADMEKRASELRSLIPPDHVEVTVTKTGDFDGWPILEYEAEGVKLKWDQVNTIGTASAIRPGALGAFAEVRIASIGRDDLERIKKEQQCQADANKAAKVARDKELMETPIPDKALSAYKRYHGDADTAWEREDESSWALINRWKPYIEAQHGIDPVKLQRIVHDASRESNYGIND